MPASWKSTWLFELGFIRSYAGATQESPRKQRCSQLFAPKRCYSKANTGEWLLQMQNQNMKMTKITITNQYALLAKNNRKNPSPIPKILSSSSLSSSSSSSSIIHYPPNIIYHLSSFIYHLSSTKHHLSSIIYHQSSIIIINIIYHQSSIIYDDHHRILPLKEPFCSFGSDLCCCPWLDCLGAPIDLQEVVERWLAIRRREDSQGFKWCEKKGKIHETSYVYLMFFCEIGAKTLH